MSDLIIYKNNELIENFIFNASEAELQILNYAVAVTNPAWENKNLVYHITIPDLVDTYKTKSNNAYKHYREALRKLMRREYSFRNSRGHLVTENMVIRTTEDPDDNTWLEFKFNEYISSRLSNLSGLFTKYDIKNIAMFKSKYAFILYDFFRMRLDQLPDGIAIYCQKISISNFKENLDLSDNYKRFSNLQNKVLEVAKLNINKHSNIKFSYEVIKTGRTPTHIKFTVMYKKPIQTKKIAPDRSKAEHQDVIDFDTGEQPEVTKTERAKAKIFLANIKENIKNGW